MVKVSINDLNIRKGAGTNTAKTGRIVSKDELDWNDYIKGKRKC